MAAGHPNQDICTYSLHQNDSVVLQEMEQFGLQPWTIKIVNAQLPTAAGLPTINEVPSIQPKIFAQNRQASQMAPLTLHWPPFNPLSFETTPTPTSPTSELNILAP